MVMVMKRPQYRRQQPLLHHQLMRPQARPLIRVLTWPLSLPRLLLDSAIAWHLTAMLTLLTLMVIMQ